MIGRLLDGRYKILQILGAGGFSQTYLALDTRRPSSPTCVVKHLKPTSDNPGSLEIARRLFRSEAETLERIGHHDQIPRLLAYFEEDEEFYLVQEFIEGHVLTTELQPGRLMSEAEVVALLQDGLSTLAFVHSQGVIHRDVKPDNLIRRSSDGKLVLVDFGAVKTVWSRPAALQRGGTIAGTIIGTPGYMSTEQGRGKPRPSSDIYALGMIGIQALTGLAPMELQEDSGTGEPMWQQHTQVSAAFAAIIDKMVAYHFKDRYQSAGEALEALQKVYGLSSSYTAPPPPPNFQPAPPPPVSSERPSEPAPIESTTTAREETYYGQPVPFEMPRTQPPQVAEAPATREETYYGQPLPFEVPRTQPPQVAEVPAASQEEPYYNQAAAVSNTATRQTPPPVRTSPPVAAPASGKGNNRTLVFAGAGVAAVLVAAGVWLFGSSATKAPPPPVVSAPAAVQPSSPKGQPETAPEPAPIKKAAVLPVKPPARPVKPVTKAPAPAPKVTKPAVIQPPPIKKTAPAPQKPKPAVPAPVKAKPTPKVAPPLLAKPTVTKPKVQKAPAAPSIFRPATAPVSSGGAPFRPAAAPLSGPQDAPALLKPADKPIDNQSK